MKLDHKNQHLDLQAHSKCAIQNFDNEAVRLILKSGLSLLDAARICLALVEAAGGECRLAQLHELIATAAQVQEERRRSVSFEEAVKTCLHQKQHRSKRTLQDIRQTMNALMRFDPQLAQRPIRELNSGDCHRLLHGAFAHSTARFIKARANLSGVFTVAYRHGWCGENPVKRVATPTLHERRIEPLKPAQVKRLLSQAKRPEHSECLPALGLMLYAGVRPEELQRLQWDDIDWDEGVLYMSARHCKTGGGRHVPLAKPLMKLLKQRRGDGAICPKNWRNKWLQLRQLAGFDDWVPDILRHSYASYHAKMYRDLPLLQLSMGHRDSRLLLTRYINLRGITKKDAQEFWQGSGLVN